MTNYSFYITKEKEITACKLIEKFYNNNKENKILLLCHSEDHAELMDNKLWMFSKLSFIPHGSKFSVAPESAPECYAWISDKEEFVNNPSTLILPDVDYNSENFENILYISNGIREIRRYIVKYDISDYTIWEDAIGGWRKHERSEH